MENYLREAKGFDILLKSLVPYEARELILEYGGNDWWQQGVLDDLHDDQKRDLPAMGKFNELCNSLDVMAALRILDFQWGKVFRRKLPRDCRTWAIELKGTRNRWAHRGAQDISDNDTWRALDTMSRLCEQIDPDGAAEINALLREARYGRAEGSVTVTTNASAPAQVSGSGRARRAETIPAEGLPSWRDVMEPHQDVAEGRYRNAEFAADLAQVARGEGSLEYRDPVEFFGRTYVTEGMKGLLVQSLKRVAGLDGEPVIQLKTAFGGGKTHSMLALYHLLRSPKLVRDIPNVRPTLEAAGAETIPQVHVAVVVGTALNPAKAKRPADLPGVTVNTIWGEIAYQLAVSCGNRDVYEFVRDADRRHVSPGSQALKEMFDACGCALVLVDELVAYAKKLYGADSLVAGTFDNFITFIQELTEAVRASERSLVVASIPESDREIGGDSGQRALEAIEHTFGRMESIWKPVSASEGFEVVRRRLFLDCKDPAKRKVVCNAYSRMYNDNAADFPVDARELEYRDRMVSCYPIHPEVFDRLYEDWATLETFQRTRGVLRLMAAVIHELWVSGDESPMIMPGSFPLDVAAVRDELTRYLDENWNGVVDSEIDGRNSLPFREDQSVPRYGRLMACRRVSRTVMLGSAPDVAGQNARGIERSHIRLGVVQPGENVSYFNDALSTLQNASTFLYSDGQGNRFWYDTRPTLRKTMEDRAQQVSREDAAFEVERRLKAWRRCEPFAGLHVCPASSLDVPDEQRLRLVALAPGFAHRNGDAGSAAVGAAQEILDTRGTAPRQYKNTLVFVVCDAGSVASLSQAARAYLAWRSIADDKEALNLDMAQARETDQNVTRADETLKARIQEAYSWLLAPAIDLASGSMDITWDIDRIAGGGEDAPHKAARKLIANEGVITQWAPQLLTMELDRVLWHDADKHDIRVRQLWDYLCTYCYLPRLSGFSVLEDAIRQGSASREYFGIASGFTDGRYLDLTLGQARARVNPTDLLVKRAVAADQLEREEEERAEDERRRREQTAGDAGAGAASGDGGSGGGHATFDGLGGIGGSEARADSGEAGGGSIPATESLPVSFAMSAGLDSTRVSRDVRSIMEEIVSQLTALDDAEVELKLEVRAHAKAGFPASTQRTISENCNTLHIREYRFGR